MSEENVSQEFRGKSIGELSKELAKELHKPIIRKCKEKKVFGALI